MPRPAPGHADPGERIGLQSDALSLCLDPHHGAEILELISRPSGRQLLARPGFAPAPPLGGDLDEEPWTAAYRGGWQLAAPNAGNRCVVSGVHHGFHGRASVDPWEILALRADAAAVTLRWQGHGLELRRAVSIDGARVRVAQSWTALAAPAPLIVAEHLIFGPAVFSPEVRIDAPAVAHETSEREGPPVPPPDAPPWPGWRRRDGRVEHDATVSKARARARFGVLSGWKQGHAVLDNPARGLAVTVAWDTAVLPAVWLWEEIRGTGGIWGHRAELLGFEPAVTPHSLGLAEALRHGQALWATPGRWDGYQVALSIRDGNG